MFSEMGTCFFNNEIYGSYIKCGTLILVLYDPVHSVDKY